MENRMRSLHTKKKKKPSYIFNLCSQYRKWSCQNRQVVNVFNVGTKTMECTGQSPQN